MAEDLMQALAELRNYLHTDRCYMPPDSLVDDAFATVETFCAIALRVFAKTNPSKIRSEAVTVELSTLVGK